MLDFIRVTLWSRSSSPYFLHFSCPRAPATIRQHADLDSTILASPSIPNFLSFTNYSDHEFRPSLSPSRVLPDFPDLPYYPSHACNFFFHRLSALDVRASCFWLVDEFSSLLPLFNSPLDLALRKYEFELAALFSSQIRTACVSFVSVFPSSRFRYFQI